MRFTQTFTIAYSPWTNGCAENVNQIIIKLLRILGSELQIAPEDVKDVLPDVQHTMNHTKMRSQLFHGRPLNDRICPSERHRSQEELR